MKAFTFFTICLLFSGFIYGQSPKITYDFPDNEHLSFGLGWSLVKGLPGDEYALVHTGADMGVRTAIILLPVSKRGLVVFTNGDNGQQVIKNIVTAALDCGSSIIEYMNH